MIKKITLLPLILILVIFSACEFSTTTQIHGETISPEYKLSASEFKNEIATITEFEDLTVSTTVFEKDGSKDHSITIEIKNPKSSFDNKIRLMAESHRIISRAKESISNIEEYDKIVVKYSEEKDVDGIIHNISFKNEVDL